MINKKSIFIFRTLIFSLSIIPAFCIALYLDDDFPKITDHLNILQTFWTFLVLSKWGILLGAIAYLLCYFLIGRPFTWRKHIGFLLVTALIAWIGPVTLFDVGWIGGGPTGLPLTVYPVLYDDMVPLFIKCAIAFYLFYCFAFLIIPDNRKDIEGKEKKTDNKTIANGQ